MLLQTIFFGANWVDLAILIFLSLALLGGWRRGFLGSFLDLLAFILAFFFALKMYPLVAAILASRFPLDLGLAKPLAFLLAGVLAEIAFAFILKLLHGLIPQEITQNFYNRLLGFFFATFQSIVLLAFLLAIAVILPAPEIFKNQIFASKIGSELVRQTQKTEGFLRRAFGGEFAEDLRFVTIGPQGKETVDLTHGLFRGELKVDETLEIEMFKLVNQERAKRGAGKLSWDDNLVEVARGHALDIFQTGYFSHYDKKGLSPAARLHRAGIIFIISGENLALAPSLEIAHRGLMESSGHRANILSRDFGRIGIGAIDGGIYGKMFVQEFTD